MNNPNFAFDRINYILLAIGMAIVVAGFILMSGAGSTETAFDPDIFSARRIKVAPAVCFAGFAFMVYGIMHRPKEKEGEA
ncbi:MAG: DUF3098 domain-containing protein [Bacteroidaceae bacterium]|nr:DUF3098 domain-containing protein [Bacteroidaceae bacterium]